ncbi:MAG: protein kinase domain-containing protein [Planctomycetota bacterium]|jgi:tetratricopeptide (TPR) repeat protein
MVSDYDLLFGRVAVELGYLTQETLEAVFDSTARASHPHRIGIVLKEKGLLTGDQFREITAAVSARTGAPDSDGDDLFSRLCIKRKFALAYRVRQMLAERREALRRIGTAPALQDLLVSEGVITREQARLVLQDCEGYLLCPGCHGLVDVRAENPGTEIACRRCDHLLRVKGGTRSASEGEGVRPEGHRVGDYRLVREIGKGSTGVVYEARNLATGGPVALKILPEAMDLDAMAVERFRREAEIVSRAEHPSIVPILEVGEEEGAFFIVLEYVEGETLDTLLGDAPFSIPLSVDTSLQVAKGLQYAHERGIIHRDVKPANILLDRSGCARILDFGLAKRRDVATITASGAVVGTPMYMSPEQASPGAAVDPRTDIYSLGATLYEILTGVPPFVGTDVQSLIRKVRRDEPPLPRSIRPDLPRPLENIVLKAMAKVVRRRYDTAAEFAEDLERFRDRGEALARAPGPWARGSRFVSRNREWLILVMMAMALIGGGWLLWELRAPRPGRGPSGGEGDVPAVEALASAAFNALRLGHHEEAVALYSKLKAKEPGDSETLVFRARAYRGLGQDEKALDDLREALRLNPDHLPVRYERANLLFALGRYAEAAKDLRIYARERPDSVPALVLLGRALAKTNRMEEATETLMDAEARDPSRVDARLLLAELLIERDPGEARERLRALARSAPEQPRVHFLLGRAEEVSGAPEEALRAYREAVRRQGLSPALRESIERVERLIERGSGGDED